MNIQLADQDRIHQVEDIAAEFLQAIFGIDYNECLITDETRLWDFMPFEEEDEEKRIWIRVFEIYGLSRGDWERKYLVDMLEEIQRQRR